MKRNSKLTPIQKKIKKRLIDEDMTMTDVANWHGHTLQNASIHLARQNENYFFKAIEAMKSEPQTI